MKEKIAETFKEFRQYLCNTEFAPPPFDDTPFDPKMINEVFPNQILSLLEEKIKMSLLTDEEIDDAADKACDKAEKEGICKTADSCMDCRLREKAAVQAQLDKVLKIVEGDDAQG